jgi:hypothetical protein
MLDLHATRRPRRPGGRVGGSRYSVVWGASAALGPLQLRMYTDGAQRCHA